MCRRFQSTLRHITFGRGRHSLTREVQYLFQMDQEKALPSTRFAIEAMEQSTRVEIAVARMDNDDMGWK